MLPSRYKELLNDLESLEQSERFELLIEFAERFQPVPESIATSPYRVENRVPGCESEVYVWNIPDSKGLPKWYFAVENPQGISAKAMAVILDETLSGESPEQIAQIPQESIYTIFGRTLSMGKGQGLMSMLGVIKVLAQRSL
ncbi:MAG: SufE family protein [Bdellovibrionales bacterium]|nr:SufE family protein [Bdellovibrionales bacterium]